MLKRMRWRFIGSAMAAIVVVVLALVVGMNLWNYHLSVQRQDDILRGLADRDWDYAPPAHPGVRPENAPPEDTGTVPLEDEASAPIRNGAPGLPAEGEEVNVPGLFGGRSQEFRYTLRFFSVRCDAAGTAVETDREFIASVTSEEAAAWGEKVVKSGRASGYLNGYRYLCSPDQDGGHTVLFLNAERETQLARTLLLVSTVVAAVCLLVVFGLVVLFSKRAIAPYVRNIETQKRFITDAGHELKTPLTAISASADLLALDAPDSEWVASIQTECARMSRLVADLVILSRLDEEQPFPQRADFSFSDAVWEIAEPMGSMAKAKGKGYEQSIADGLVCHGDRAAIQQTVSILLDNALKYADEGGIIRLSAARVRGRIQLEVFNTCDTTGLDISRLFDRFYRPDTARSAKTGGTGIGLSIARATAQAHGGTISARLGDGGITFILRL